MHGYINFRHQLYNESGFVLMVPAVDENDLVMSHPPDPLTESETQLFPLGSKLIQGERVWRYCKNSAAALTVIGYMQASAAIVHADHSEDAVVAASAGEAYAIGSHDISITSTANIAAAPWSTENGGKEGYIFVNGGTGVGQCRKIKFHEAFSSTDSTLVTVYEGWSVAPVAADTECGFMQNPYSNTITCPALAGYPVGVNTIAVTASRYYWAQSGGPCAVTCHAAIPVGTLAVVGTTVGDIDPLSAFTTEVIVGIMLTPGIKDDDAALVFLTLDR